MYALRQATGSLRIQSSIYNTVRNNGTRSFCLDQVLRNNGESSRDGYSESASDNTDVDIDIQNRKRQDEDFVGENGSIETVSKTSDKEQEAKSYLDKLFNSKDDFHRDEYDARERQIFYKNRSPEDELNQGWGDYAHAPETRGAEKRRMERTLQRKLNERRKRGADPYEGSLTPPERRAFSDVFESVLSDDRRIPQPKDEKGKQNVPFGSFRADTNEQQMQNFQRRNTLQVNSLPFPNVASRLSDFQSNVRARSPHKVDKVGIVRELIAGSDKDEAQLLQDFDKAQTEISACQSTYAIWDWARENVWGQPRKGVFEMEVLASETTDSEATSDQTAPDARSVLKNSILPSSEPKFGVNTPFYAPVLRQLMIELRNRFHSPQSALNILRVTKNAGTESVVLGCTPALYAEAIKTSWFAFGDLADVIRLVEEAKTTGALSTSRRGSHKRQRGTRGSTEEMLDNLHNDSIIRSLLEKIHSDAYKLTWKALAKIYAHQRSQGIAKGTLREWQENVDMPLLLQERFSLLSKLEDMVAYGNRKQRK